MQYRRWSKMQAVVWSAVALLALGVVTPAAHGYPRYRKAIVPIAFDETGLPAGLEGQAPLPLALAVNSAEGPAHVTVRLGGSEDPLTAFEFSFIVPTPPPSLRGQWADVSSYTGALTLALAASQPVPGTAITWSCPAEIVTSTGVLSAVATAGATTVWTGLGRASFTGREYLEVTIEDVPPEAEPPDTWVEIEFTSPYELPVGTTHTTITGIVTCDSPVEGLVLTDELGREYATTISEADGSFSVEVPVSTEEQGFLARTWDPWGWGYWAEYDWWIYVPPGTKDPALLRVTSPSQGATCSGRVRVSGQVKDYPTSWTWIERLLVNGVVVPLVNSASDVGWYTFDTWLTAPQSGPFEVRVVVQGWQPTGQPRPETIEIRNVTIDLEPPSIQVLSPVEGAVVQDAPWVQVEGLVQDPSLLWLQLNGTLVTTSPGLFATQASLVELGNTLTLMAMDRAGQTTSVVRHVTRSSTAPDVVVESPTPFSWVGTSTVLVRGTASDESGITSLTVQGIATDVVDGRFEAQAAVDGNYSEIVVEATNALSQVTCLRIPLNVDLDPPVFGWDNPADDLVTSATAVTVSGWVLERNLSSVLVNGLATSLTRDGAWWSYQLSVALPADTPILLRVVATDSAGQVTERCVTVESDRSAPVVQVTKPAPCTDVTDAPFRSDLEYWCAQPDYFATDAIFFAGAVGQRVYLVQASGVSEWDPATSSWRRWPGLPSVRAGMAGAVVGSDIWITGGYIENMWVKACQTRTDIFSTVTGTWRVGPPLPRTRGGHSAFVVDGVLHLVGGLTGGQMVGYYPYYVKETTCLVHDTYDVANLTWSTKVMPPEYSWMSCQSAVLGRQAYFVSNENFAVYSVDDNTWARLPNVPDTAGYAAVTTFGSRLLVLGGYDALWNMSDATRSFDTVQGIWSDGPRMSGKRRGPVAACLGARAMVFGGYDDQWTLRTTFDELIRGGYLVDVEGTYQERHLVSIRCNASAVTVAADTFSAVVPLPVGPGRIKVTAQDTVGHVTVLSHAVNVASVDLMAVEVTCSSTAPELEAHREVTLRGVLANVGSAMVTTTFEAELRVDGIVVARRPVPAGLTVGAQATVEAAWRPVEGQHQVSLVVDPTDGVGETNETNNTVSRTLPLVVDRVPPPPPTNLTVTCGDTFLRFEWTPSANTDGDLAGYRACLDGGTPFSVFATHTNYLASGLAPGSTHAFRLWAFDDVGLASSEVATSGSTLLPNPSGLTAGAMAGAVALAWSPVEPSDLVGHFAVYVAPSNFTSVTGMTPSLVTTALQATMSGLINGTTYWFAVTTVTLSGGEPKAVAAVSAIPHADHEGPIITAIALDGVPLVDGSVVQRSGTVTAHVADPAGVSRVEFLLDGALKRTDYSGAATSSWTLDALAIPDGSHTLTIRAMDGFANLRDLALSLTFQLGPPAAPTITSPVAGTMTNRALQDVTGRSVPGAEVVLLVNGEQQGTFKPTTLQCSFSGQVTLVEGQNALQAVARLRSSVGPASEPVLVTLQTNLPDPPLHLSVQAQAGGVLHLVWEQPLKGNLKGFHVYRATQSFALPVAATRMTAVPLNALAFDDLPPADATYFYRLTSVDLADNESSLSTEAFAASDRIAPHAVAIEYGPQGPHDPATGRVGPGVVSVTVRVNEPLAVTPFLSLNVPLSPPLAIELAKRTASEYAGLLLIQPSTPSGTACAVFSARDLAGNRGTAVDVGGTLPIDTAGPAVARLALSPPSPIKNDEASPVTVMAVLGLDESSTTTPALSYTLAGASQSSIQALERTTPASGEADAWRATFTLPATAGLAAAESLRFVFGATDDLGNAGSKFLCTNDVQVYQGVLPPLAVPGHLTATSRPAGYIVLTWNAVQGASGYALYRKGPSEASFTGLTRLGPVTSWTDRPTIEGLYAYTVASIRHVGAEDSDSGQSAPAQALSDRTPPTAPGDLALELVPQGVRATWTVPATTDTLSYCLYRSAQAEISTTEGLTLVLSDLAVTTALDAAPTVAERYYAVTARDAAGNESLPSGSAYVNLELLPVRDLLLVQAEATPPVLTWTPPGASIAGSEVYLADDKLTAQPLQEPRFVDSGWTGDERRYRVLTLDDQGHVSLARALTLPALNLSLAPGQTLRRGVMNRLDAFVSSASKGDTTNATLSVALPGGSWSSAPFSVAGQSTQAVAVVVPGLASLPDMVLATCTVELAPEPGVSVRIVRSSPLEVREGALVARLMNDEFVRGGTGLVRFSLENTGSADAEVVTARAGQPSDELTLSLLDADGNVLSVQSVRQILGGGVLTLPNGVTIARLAPGATFTSEAVALPIPLACPDSLILRLQIQKVHYHLGQGDSLELQGLTTTRSVRLISTSYYGEVLSATPELSDGKQPVRLVGRAVQIATGQPLANVPLKLIVGRRGFERSFALVTDAAGGFVHDFTPSPSESGRYDVCAIHPELDIRPDQVHFTIRGFTVAPVALSLVVPRNYEQRIAVMATAGEGTEVHNLRLVCDPLDQPGGSLPDHMTLTTAPPLALLGSGQAATLACTLWADGLAQETAALVLRVVSDDTPDTWATIQIAARMTDAVPDLDCTPAFLQTGLAQGGSVLERLTLENHGFADALDVTLSLVDQSGAPAPAWVHLDAVSPGVVRPGERREVSLLVAPGSSVPSAVYDLSLRIRSSNGPARDVPVSITLTQSGVGSALFKVSDIYTGTVDKDTHEILQGLEGATVKLQSELVPTLAYSQATDAVGEALFSGVQAGRYLVRVTASGHDAWSGRVWVRPGITVVEQVFLMNTLVQVEWDVTETTIQDQYGIVLHTTFETDVPAPVVIAEPPSVALPRMSPGDVFSGEFTLTNFGLVRADDVSFVVPASDLYLTIELPNGLPDHLDAKQQLRVPYRVTCKQSLIPAAGGAGGGSCVNYSQCVRIPYCFVCANGTKQGGSTKVCIVVQEGDCSGDGTPFVFGRENFQFTGGTSSNLQGIACPRQERRRQCSLKQCPPCKSDCNTTNVGASYVNEYTKEYYDDPTDLSVRVPGGTIDVTREYYFEFWPKFLVSTESRATQVVWLREFGWHFWHEQRNRLRILGDGSLDIGGVPYDKQPDGSWKSETFTARRLPDGSGFHAKSRSGEWQQYDAEGRLTSYGDLGGVLAKVLIQDGKVVGLSDRNDRQVIWFEYDTDGLLSVARDFSGRHVEYKCHLGGDSETRLLIDEVATHPDDATTYRQTYEYQDTLVTKVVAPNGNEERIVWFQGMVASVTNQNGVGFNFVFDYDKTKEEFYSRTTSPSGRVKEMWFGTDGKPLRRVENGVRFRTTAYTSRDEVVTDIRGNVSTTTYDEFGNPVKEVSAAGLVTRTEYDLRFNKPSRLVDPKGLVTTWAYDDKGRVLRQVQALGTEYENSEEFSYDQDGRKLSEVKYWGTTEISRTTYTYNGEGMLASVTDAEGGVTNYTQYDAMGNVLERVDPRGFTWKTGYDALGRVVSETDPLNNVTSYTRDASGNVVVEERPGGRRTDYQYDAQGRLVKTISPPDAQGRRGEKSQEYGTNGLLVATTDPLGRVTQYFYDELSRLVATVDPAGGVRAVSYDTAGAVTGAVDVMGNQTLCSYDSQGRMVETSGPSGLRSVTTHDVWGRVASRVDSEGNVTSFEYDVLDRPILERRPDGSTVGTEYDPATFKTTTIDPAGRRTETVTDKLGRVVVQRRFLEGQSLERWSRYDAAGNLVGTTDEAGRSAGFQYDELGRLVQTTDSLGGITAKEYDTAGNVLQLTNAKGNSWSSTYDLLGRPLSQRDPLGNEMQFVHDLAGDLVMKSDAKGQVTTFTWDPLHRLSRVDYADGEWAEIAYDAGGNRTSIRGSGPGRELVEIHQTFDAANRLKTVTNSALHRRVTYSYARDGEVASTRVVDAQTNTEEQAVTYERNQMGQVVRVEPWVGGAMTCTYNPDGTRRSVTLPNSIDVVYSYDGIGRLSELEYRRGQADVVAFFRYSFDLVGNPLTMQDAEGLTQYGYDLSDRLLAASYPDGTWERFTYDAAGNRTRLESQDGSIDYSYDAGDRLLTERGLHTLDYTWDPNGNLASRADSSVGTSVYDWSARGKLVRLHLPDGTGNQYEYLPTGDLRYRIVNRQGVGQRILWDPLTASTLQYCDESGRVGMNVLPGVLATEVGGFVQDERVLTNIADRLGSVRGVLDSSGTVTGYTYSAFGQPRGVLSDETYRRFAGTEWCVDGELYYARARYLSPRVGRFLSADALGDRRPTLYAYSGDNPTRWVDPLGLAWTQSGDFWQETPMGALRYFNVDCNDVGNWKKWCPDDASTVLLGSLLGERAPLMGKILHLMAGVNGSPSPAEDQLMTAYVAGYRSVSQLVANECGVADPGLGVGTFPGGLYEGGQVRIRSSSKVEPGKMHFCFVLAHEARHVVRRSTRDIPSLASAAYWSEEIEADVQALAWLNSLHSYLKDNCPCPNK